LGAEAVAEATLLAVPVGFAIGFAVDTVAVVALGAAD
jgi:hypothetical protein